MAQTKISQFGEEFGLVEHQLRLQLGAPLCKVSEVINISLKAMSAQFNHYIKNMPNPNLVDVFLPLYELPQTRSEIIQKGLKVDPKKGLKFRTSNLKLDPSKENYELLHVVVALGKVLNYQTPLSALGDGKFESLENVTSANVLDGFDSLKVSEEDEFLIFHENQIDTLHVVRVEGGQNIAPQNPFTNKCDSCGKQNAVLYCNQDGMKLCTICDEKIHKVSEILKQHTRIPLGDALVATQKCPEHPDHVTEYYCMKCHLPICMECKVHGSHSHAPASKHKLISFSEAYATQGNGVKEPSQIRINRAKSLKAAILETQHAISDVEQNLQATIDEINRIAQKAIEDAKLQAGERLLVAKSALAELNRKQRTFKAQREIVTTYYTSGTPADFLQAYHRNELLEPEIESNLDLQTCREVHGDLAVFGVLEVGAAPPKSTTTVEEEEEEEEEKPKPVSVKFTTLAKMAERKAKKYEQSGKALEFRPFEGSEIIVDDEIARRLYMCLPFKATPETHLLFSTAKDGRSVAQMHRMVDGMGITAIVIRSGGRSFGGFAASKWNADGHPFGDGSSSFLFSLDNDAFIPAHPQSEEPIYLLGTKETFTFGREDLVIGGNFDHCASTIENTFGIGLRYGGEEAQTFLAGKPRFAADLVEVWGFFSPK